MVPAIAIGVALWATAAILGAQVAFRAVPGLETALTALGATLLLWFGARYLRRAAAWDAEGVRALAPTARAAFLTTLAIIATNPKALTTWLVLVTIFPVGEASAPAVAVMIAGSIVVASLGHAGYALAFSTRAAARAYARAGRWITGGVGIGFVALGLGLWREVVSVVAL